jgi:hypothetical protein
LAWDEPRSVEFIMLLDSASPQRMIKSGHVVLNDDPSQTITNIVFPDGAGEAAILRFPEKKEISSITFVADEMQVADGVAGMSEIIVLGPPAGHVWLSSPMDLSTVRGETPVEIRGLRSPVTEVNVTLTPVTDGVKTPAKPLYTGAVLPDRLLFDSMQVEDGTYDLRYSVTMANGENVVIKNRIIVSNWKVVEDAVEATTANGWFGEMKHMLTVAETPGWEFVGSSDELLFGDADRIRQKSNTEESLTWELERLRSFEFTLFARNPEIAQAIQVAVSADGKAWAPVAFSTKAVGQAAGGQKISVSGTLPSATDAKLIQITFNKYAQPMDLQLGHVVLRGLSAR